MKQRVRKAKDTFLLGGISMMSLVGVMVLALIMGFIINRGVGLLTWDLLIGDYHPTTYNLSLPTTESLGGFARPNDLDESAFFSQMWGLGLMDDVDFEGKAVVRVIYVDAQSPLQMMRDKNNLERVVGLFPGLALEKVIFSDLTIGLSRTKAENFIILFDTHEGINDLLAVSSGNGIRGAIITTGLLIGFALMIALPIGIFSAVYLHEFAPKNNAFIHTMRKMIDTLSGVPSIVYGLMGAAVFIPFTSRISKAEGGNLFSGALTLAVMVLPIIISATIDALRAVPDDYRKASLALGANHTQTTFRIVIKSAVPGIMSAVLLSVGRMIGESAALIYAVGTAIKDHIILTEKSASLAVFIWSVMAGEVPNFELACSVAIIIMAVVLFINVLIKLVARRFTLLP
ncbi:MAG: ABC transporter permease subunit [Candidatus Izemoplasmatales bacterium]|jgi:phosphate transport system permease protein